MGDRRHTDSLIEESEALGHEVAHVREVEKCQWNADECVDDRYQPTPFRLGRHVAVTCTHTTHTVRALNKVPVKIRHAWDSGT